MEKSLSVFAFPILIIISGCGPFIEVIPLDQKTTERLKSEVKIYWDANEIVDTQYVSLGPLTATSCKILLWDSPPSEEDAISQLQYKATLKGGNGVLTPSCERFEGTSLGKNCWASITCHGVAIKVGPGASEERVTARAVVGDLLGGSIEDLAKQLSAGIKNHPLHLIAVLPLYDASYEVNRPLGNYLAERLTNELYKTDSAKVVERAQLAKVVEELRLTMTGRFDEATVKKIGKLLGVDAVVVGSYTELGNQSVEVNSRILNAETAEILGVGTIQIPAQAVAPLMR